MEEPFQRELDPALRRWIEDTLVGVAYNGPPNTIERPPLEVVSAAAFYERPSAPAEHLLGPLIVRGQRLVIGAGTGEGKSTFLMWMVRAFAKQTRFLDWLGTGGRVLLVDAEQTDEDIKRLLVETGLHESADIDILHVPDGLSLNRSTGEVAQVEKILAAGRYDIVALDPLYKLHDAHPNDPREAVALMKMFDRWRTAHNFGLILPAHMRKAQGKDRDKPPTIDDIHGVGEYLRGAEVVVGLTLKSDGFSRLSFFKSRSPGLPVRKTWNLSFHRDTGFMVYEPPKATGTRARSTEEDDQLVQTVLVQAGGAGVEMKAILEETGKSRDTVERMLKRLGAVSRPMPNNKNKKLWFLGDAEPDEIAMEIHTDPDEDEDGREP